MSRVTATPLNAVHDRISSDEQATLWELRDRFTFEVPGARHTPKFKAGVWDGTIKLLKNGLLYAGLRDRVREFCDQNGYEFREPELRCNALSVPGIDEWIKGLGLPFEPRPYQFEYFVHALHAKRCVIKCPTAGGKSLIIYLLARWYWDHHKQKTLVIVPTKGLVGQMPQDFLDYGCPPELVSKRGEDQDTPFLVSTWQWVMRQEPEWFAQWDQVVGDEAHTFKAASLIKIMESLPDCRRRVGTTGTIDTASPVNPLVLEGLFGPIYEKVTSQDLQDQGYISKLKVKVIKLVHPAHVRKGFAKTVGKDYDQELDYIVSCQQRNEFLVNLSTALRGNTILLFRFVEKHGHVLWPMLSSAREKSHYIYGGVGEDERAQIKRLLEVESDQTLLASTGTFSMGENVRRLHNIIFGSPYKSQIVVVQSIGRGLRLHEDKDGTVLYDVADDLSWKTRKNHTLKHMEARIKIYAREGFDYSVTEVPMDY